MSSPGSAVRSRVAALDEKAAGLPGASREENHEPTSFLAARHEARPTFEEPRPPADSGDVEDIPDAEWATLHRIALQMSLQSGADEAQKEKTKKDFQESINRLRQIHLQVVGNLRKQIRAARAELKAEAHAAPADGLHPEAALPGLAAAAYREVVEAREEGPPEITPDERTDAEVLPPVPGDETSAPTTEDATSNHGEGPAPLLPAEGEVVDLGTPGLGARGTLEKEVEAPATEPALAPPRDFSAQPALRPAILRPPPRAAGFRSPGRAQETDAPVRVLTAATPPQSPLTTRPREVVDATQVRWQRYGGLGFTSTSSYPGVSRAYGVPSSMMTPTSATRLMSPSAVPRSVVPAPAYSARYPTPVRMTSVPSPVPGRRVGMWG